ncbi:MAG: hypothetical protein PHY09_10675 [Desulfuromonadaceae bacterium]|nr:hypothetical protein [Desulfuromonadaceae bacterium]MDD5105216.1 hypothetical protein [Desulfuromonadaceae bacterium]
MADTWITDITHFLDEDGKIISDPVQARKLAEFFAAIIMMATFPNQEYPREYVVKCRRRPNRKYCLEEISGWIEPESDDIYWICPQCQDKGRISNWRGTMWDMSEFDKVVH